jgi:hypothetical protein
VPSSMNWRAIVRSCGRLCVRGSGSRKPRLRELTGLSEHSIGARLSDLKRAGVAWEKRRARALGPRVYVYRVKPGAST